MSTNTRRVINHSNFDTWPSHFMGSQDPSLSIFRSKNEWYVATLLDLLDIRWEYESSTFTLSSGETYTPDFYLPECGVYLEAKSGTDIQRLHKTQELADMLDAQARELDPHGPGLDYMPNKSLHVYVILDGELHLVEPNTNTLMNAFKLDVPDFWAQCRKCERWYPASEYASWECRYCSYYAGNHFKNELRLDRTEERTSEYTVTWHVIKQCAQFGPRYLVSLREFDDQSHDVSHDVSPEVRSQMLTDMARAFVNRQKCHCVTHPKITPACKNCIWCAVLSQAGETFTCHAYPHDSLCKSPLSAG